MGLTLLVVLLSLLVFISSIFSFAETMLVGRADEMIHSLSKKKKDSPLLDKLIHNKDKLLSVTLFGSNMCNSMASSAGTLTLINLLSSYNINGGYIVLFSTFLVAAFIFLFGEVLPKSLGLIVGGSMGPITIRIVAVLSKVLYPIVAFTDWIVKGSLRLFGMKDAKSRSSTSQEISMMVEARHLEGKIFKYYRDMLKGLLRLDRTEVSSIMTHRTDIFAVDINLISPEDLVKAMLSSTYSRVPVYENSPDNVIGILHTKDVSMLYYKNGKNVSIKDLKGAMKKPMFVTENATLYKQLLKFRTNRNHIAIVVDEFGTFIGVVTLEDIMEEIVGDINDEHDTENGPDVVKHKDLIIVDGDYLVHDFCREFDIEIEEQDAKTMAGLIIDQLERIPEVGEKVKLLGYEACIKATKQNKITRIEMKKKVDSDEGYTCDK